MRSIGIFVRSIGIFVRSIGIFVRSIGIFVRSIGIFVRSIGIVCTINKKVCRHKYVYFIPSYYISYLPPIKIH